ncbi:hypothetical protein PGT21_031670 [Puccinia graminis f. sp. tritici]|uniref:Uncharacterized protein n=1 Tax=Puccinia graminis f. sp. tritici TaxID=56615 RepID=A0A5B0LPT0_PUCGR|nr:hypothetical protein PGT21_031670 [Puccinia graminis f. sp. tritici]
MAQIMKANLALYVLQERIRRGHQLYSSLSSILVGTGYPKGYPDIRQFWAEKQPSAAESASAGGYPLALAGIRQRIADIRGGLSATISRN